MANGYMKTEDGYKNPGVTITTTDTAYYTCNYRIDPGLYAVSGTWYTPDGQICQKRKPVYKYQLLNWIGER